MSAGAVRAAVLLLAPACVAAGARAEVVERIVAKVNRDIITYTEWQDVLQGALAQSRTPAGDAARRALESEVLERMISDKLVGQAARDEGLKVTETEVAPAVDRELEEVRKRFGSEREFSAQLRREGLTLEDLRARYTQQMMDRYLYLKILGRKQRELDATAEVTDDEVGAYYEAHRSRPDWQTERQVRARHIQFNVDPALTGEALAAAQSAARKKVAAAAAALKRGEPFPDVARTFSEDATTKAAGGDLGTFGAGTYHESLERAAFSLKPGRVSGVIVSPVGVHLLLVEETLPPRPKRLDETIKPPVPPEAPPATAVTEITLRDHLRGVLKRERVAAAMQSWADGLKARAVIIRFPEGEGGS